MKKKKPASKTTTIKIPIELWAAFQNEMTRRTVAGEEAVSINQAALNGLRAELGEKNG